MSFGKKDDESTSSTSTSSTTTASVMSAEGIEAFLGKGSKVVGNLTFQGPVKLGGYVEGELNSDQRLEVEESAEVKAKIKGTEIIVRGTINGDIHASKTLSLLKPAKVYGNIVTKSLRIEEGVIFEGNCQMEASSSQKSYTAPEKNSSSDSKQAAAIG